MNFRTINHADLFMVAAIMVVINRQGTWGELLVSATLFVSSLTSMIIDMRRRRNPKGQS